SKRRRPQHAGVEDQDRDCGRREPVADESDLVSLRIERTDQQDGHEALPCRNPSTSIRRTNRDKVPEIDLAVQSAAHQRLSVARDSQGLKRTAVVPPDGLLLPRGYFPQTQGAILAPRGEQAAVGRDRQRAHQIGMPSQYRPEFSRGGVPEQDFAILAG